MGCGISGVINTVISFNSWSVIIIAIHGVELRLAAHGG